MGPVRQHPVARLALVVLMVVFLAFGSKFLAGRDRVDDAPAQALKAAKHLPVDAPPPALGTWTADGIPHESKGFVDGDQRSTGRTWMVYERCSGTCRPWIARTTSLAVEHAPLEQRAGRWVATFAETTDGCGTPKKGRALAAFVFAAARDQRRVQAVEVHNATFPKCGARFWLRRFDQHATSTITWSAHRTSEACGDLVACREGESNEELWGQERDRALRIAVASCVRSGVGRAQCGCEMREALHHLTPDELTAAVHTIARHEQLDPRIGQAISTSVAACG